MKKKLILLGLSAVLLLSGCQSNAPESSEQDQTADAPVTTTAVTTTAATTTTTAPDDPEVTTTAPKTEEEPSAPVTTVPPVTEETPDTQEKPETNEPPAVDDSSNSIDKGSAKELAALLAKYPIVSAPAGSFASKTLSELIESASVSFSDSEKQSVTANGTFATSMGMLGELTRQEMELSYLTDGKACALASKLTENGYVSEDRQVYKDGWLYNTSTYTDNGKPDGTDNYKIKMTPEEFEQYVLADTDLTMDGVRDMAELFATASHIKAGMLEDGSCVILAKGYDFTAMMEQIDPDGNMTQYVDMGSFEDMETALVIGADGDMEEMYIKLPLGIKLEGIPVTMTIELTVALDIPETVSINVPNGGADYKECTIEEVYGDEDDFVFDW